MISWMRRAMRRGDEGVGLILVIGVSVFVFLLAAAAVSLAINGLTQSRNRTNFEKALASAETGIDSTLGRLQTAFTEYGADYPVPATTMASASLASQCVHPSISPDGAPGYDGTSFTTEDAERAWARESLQFIADNYPECIQNGDGGQFVVLKPPSTVVKYGRVYAMAAMPSFARPVKTRIVKDEYIFMPFRPTAAILAGGNLEISSSTYVFTAAGTDPHTAGVHANGSLTGTGNPTIDGPVTYSGSSGSLGTNKVYGGTISQVPVQQIPFLSARSLYGQAASLNASVLADWYDLCNDGSVKEYNAGGDPCEGASAGDSVAAGGSFRGWTFSKPGGVPTWTASSDTLDGTYYIDRGNVRTGNGNGTIGRLTVIASAENPDDCGTKKYGNITWDHYSIGQVALPGQWFLADSDLVTTSNFSAGSATAPVSSGMFSAGDQMNMETSSQGAVGSVVIGDKCNTTDGLVSTSEVKNPTVYYDANADGIFTSVITTALWLDYNRG